MNTATLDQVCDQATAQIVAALQKGVLPWRQSWGNQARTGGSRMSLLLPMNANTKRPYQGANIILLWLSSSMNGFNSPYWATKKTWCDIGATVAADAVPTEVYVTRAGKGSRGLFRKTYEEFNLHQVSGCDYLRNKQVAINPDYARVARLVKATEAFICSGRPFYDIIADTVFCPDREFFCDDVSYWTTLLHELVHWTGHRSRLNRKFGKSSMTDGGIAANSQYAREELIAELASCFLAAMLEIPERLEQMPYHVSYLYVWLKELNEDRQAVFTAATAAQKAADYLLRITT